MAVNLIVGDISDDKHRLQPRTVHYMPCKINFDGPVNFSKYFHPQEGVYNGDKNVLTASFHGHPLHGKETKVPEKYVGVILEKSKNFDETGEGEKKVYCTKSFDSFILWNWDKVPSKNDVVMKALDWIDIAEALHSTDME